MNRFKVFDRLTVLELVQFRHRSSESRHLVYA